MLGFGVLRQGRVYSRDFKFEDLRHDVASVSIRYLVKRGDYMAGIYLLAITRYSRFLVISSSLNIIDLVLLTILLTLRFFFTLYYLSVDTIYIISSNNFIFQKESSKVIVISRIKEINKLDLNSEEVEIRYNSNNLDFRRLTTSNKLDSFENIDITYAVVL